MRRLSCVLAVVVARLAAADQTLAPIEGTFPAGDSYVTLPFVVPAGTGEIYITHETLESGAILDWGVEDPTGCRGYGGGNGEPITIGVLASSRSYRTGPIAAGTWKVFAGKAKSASGTPGYRVRVTLRDLPTLPDEPQRSAYAAVPALVSGPRWYAGDFHTHSLESGDARSPIDQMTAYAESRGLDFIELSEHNTVSQLELMNDAQRRSPSVLLVPGMELTTYGGHANAIGATAWVDARIGLGSVTAEGMAAAVVAQGAVFSINHPVVDLNDLCIGCKWRHTIPKQSLGAVEIATGGWDETGLLFTREAIAFWDRVLDQGLHVAAIGGSDDHDGGKGTGSPIGNPTTLVFADALSVDALVSAVRKGRTMVKLQGPADPMVELTAGDAKVGDTVTAAELTARATVTGGTGAQVRWVIDGKPESPVDVTSDPFELQRTFAAPAEGETRVRAEVLIAGYPRTVTSHLWVTAPPPPESRGLCAAAPGPLAAVLALCVVLNRRRRRA